MPPSSVFLIQKIHPSGSSISSLMLYSSDPPRMLSVVIIYAECLSPFREPEKALLFLFITVRKYADLCPTLI